jgi:hypothetical protein
VELPDGDTYDLEIAPGRKTTPANMRWKLVDQRRTRSTSTARARS